MSRDDRLIDELEKAYADIMELESSDFDRDL